MSVKTASICSIFTILLTLAAVLPVPTANAASSPENRFLLVVETSRAANKCSKGIAATVESLLTSGIQGQAQPGDTIGIWTYNDKLKAGEFPLQTWSEGSGKHIASGMLAFLATQEYAHSAHFGEVASALTPIVQSSDYMTVIIVCTGSDPIRGTPFDEQLQKNVRGWRDEQQKAQMPLVVVLTAIHGQFKEFRVTPAQWQIEMPPLPTELVQARQPQPNVVAAAPPKRTTISPTVMAAPLIVSGKHHSPAIEAATPVLTSSVPAARLETNLSIAPQPVIVGQTAPSTNAASTKALSGLVDAKPEIAADSHATANSNAAVMTPRTDANHRETNLSVALAPSLPNGTLTLSSPADGSVLLKRLVLLGAVLSAFIGIVVVRRSQAGHVSLITHAIDRERE